MKRRHRYNVTHLVRTDYGPPPAGGIDVTAHLAVMPDGSHWASRPATLALRIEEGELAIGQKLVLTIENEAPTPVEPPSVSGEGVEPVVPKHWNGVGKYSCSFGFEPGGLNFRIAGWQKNGTATLFFKDDDLDYDEDGYRSVEIANSELIAIRDKLNEIFPPALNRGTSSSLLEGSE